MLKLRKSVPPRMTLPQSTDLEQDLFESEGQQWARDFFCVRLQRSFPQIFAVHGISKSTV